MNDDVEVRDWQAFDALEYALYSRPRIGAVSMCWVDEDRDHSRFITVPWCSFGCVMIRREAWEDVGELDEGFIGYGWEDVDWCRRAGLKGWKIGLTNAANIIHKSHQSFGSMPDRKALDGLSEAHYKEKWGDLSASF